MANEPVAIWTTLGALVGAFLSAMLWQFAPDLGGEVIDNFVALVVFIVPVLGGAFYARGKVTPLSDPKDADGNKLVPEGKR